MKEPISELQVLVYKELHKLAAIKMAQEAHGHSLQATALIHEAWLRLGADQQPRWKSRDEFLAAAANAMRRILIDHARKRLALKRGGGAERIDIDDLEIPAPGPDDLTKVLVHEALERLEGVDPRKAKLVELRYFGEISFEETAKVLGISVSTAKEWWAFARAWLAVEIQTARQR